MSKLIYILSAGHSGSTLLDLIAGTIPEAFSTGELMYLPWQLHRNLNSPATVDKQDICTCRKSFIDCHVWSKVVESLEKKHEACLSTDPLCFHMTPFEKEKYQQIEPFSAKFYRVLLHYSMCTPTFHFLFDRITRTAAQNSWAIIDAISEIAETPFVIDSSKDYLRLSMLYRHRPKDTYVLNLIRKVHGVSASLYKSGDPLAEASQWLKLHNRRHLPVINQIAPAHVLNIHYEELCKNPSATRNTIANFIGVTNPVTSLDIDMTNQHLVAGNPMRYKSNISIQYDEKWKTRLSTEQILAIDQIQAKLNSYFTKSNFYSVGN